MNCLNSNCQNEVTRDYPLCNTCETKGHFAYRTDCRCGACVTDRAQRAEREALTEIAWREEGQFIYGFPIQAAEGVTA